MGKCVYPGSFDPPTKGHVDIMLRTADMFDTVYVALLQNSAKQYLYDLELRKQMLQAVAKQRTNIQLVTSDGLLADLLHTLDVRVIIRGLRSSADLEYEQQLAAVNHQLAGAETVMLVSKPEMQYISSSIVRELIAYKADVSAYVPEEICSLIYGRKPYESI